ncbi:MAG: hypothetical protein GEV11_15790 [Streptosporangiales bacterium]|nr:hypothetical protein [Streptosporangiales bacterium]
MELWRGVGVALITLFDADRRLDLDGTAAHAARLVDAGVQGVLVAGTTGEADALTDEERLALVRAVREAVPNVHVMAGATGAWAGQAAERVRALTGTGADSVLVAPPRRSKDIKPYFTAVAEAAGDLPVLAYHFPGVAGGDVPVGDLAALPIAGLKDSTGDPERLINTLESWDGQTYVGASTMPLLARALGARGAILAVGNAVPELGIRAWEGDAAAQREIIKAHLRAKSSFPDGIKGLTAERFGTALHARMG